MSSLAEIQRKIAALQAEAARITESEMADAIAKVKEIIARFGLTAQQLGLRVARGARGAVMRTSPKRPGAGIAKYRDPKTGKTWTGYGRVPAWLANVKNRDAFLIDPGQASAEAPAKAKPKGAKAPAKRAATAKAAAPSKTAAKASRKAAAPRPKTKPAAPAQPASKKRGASKRAARKAVVATAAGPEEGSPDAQATASQSE